MTLLYAFIYMNIVIWALITSQNGQKKDITPV